jgi:hypothetical protein
MSAAALEKQAISKAWFACLQGVDPLLKPARAVTGSLCPRGDFK